MTLCSRPGQLVAVVPYYLSMVLPRVYWQQQYQAWQSLHAQAQAADEARLQPQPTPASLSPWTDTTMPLPALGCCCVHLHGRVAVS